MPLFREERGIRLGNLLVGIQILDAPFSLIEARKPNFSIGMRLGQSLEEGWGALSM